MDDIKALIKVISKQKVKQIEIISEDAKLSTKAKLLLDGIKSGEIENDIQAVKTLYNQDNIDSKYRKLKSRLRNRLINTLFFIDVQQFSRYEYEKAQVRAFHLVAAVKILKTKGQTNASMEIAENAFKLAEKFEMTDLALMLGLELGTHFSVFKYNKKKDKFYKKKVTELRNSLLLEIEARKSFNFYAQQINLQKKIIDFETPDEILIANKTIKENLNKNVSFIFKFNAFNALYFKSYLKNDLQEMEGVSLDALKYFRAETKFSRIGQFSFTQKLGIAYQAMGKFKSAIEVYHEALNFNPGKGLIAWFNIRNHLFNSNLAIQNYQDAYDYLFEVTENTNFKSLYAVYREPWLVKEAYTQLLIKMDKIQEDKENKLRPFRINRFLNEVPHFSKDKRGLNIAILIIHVLFLFINKKEFEIEDRLHALGQYSFRYLRNDETLRSNAFIKMLQKLPQANFHPLRLERYVGKFHKRLKETPMNISEQSAEIEIIPYEHLWEIVIELLQMRLDKKI